MSIEIIKEREIIESVEYFLNFSWSDKGGGFSFSCDEHGNVDTAKMRDAARINLWKCYSGEYDVIFKGIEKRTHTYVDPKIGKCICGSEVILDRFTNTCYDCERDYNMSGQLLADRSQWGEETGESVQDILMADCDY